MSKISKSRFSWGRANRFIWFPRAPWEPIFGCASVPCHNCIPMRRLGARIQCLMLIHSGQLRLLGLLTSGGVICIEAIYDVILVKFGVHIQQSVCKKADNFGDGLYGELIKDADTNLYRL